ncbi:glycerol transporter [Luteimicrobium album]|uniref:Glycerol transporter n=1 Tax=Luteimicrobium album TaxID=1054550 RepID=A0ABQ6I1L9_9MICO|nr:MIP/aquaporin family protein [Luteimicrobium album]GMA24639.1 glycerol transporter [Luteimicrobium album]
MTGQVFWSEVIGSALLILLGAGVVANVILPKTKGFAGGWLLINFGWGLAVFTGVYAAWKSGAHLNPAVTVGIWASGADTYGGSANLTVTFGHTLVYFAGEFIGAVLAFLAYKKHFDQDADPAVKLGVFSTGPELRSYAWNFITEVIGTFVLVYWVVVSGVKENSSGLGALGVALVVVGIGASLGGPTGYAINPTRDLAPRIAHALLPIKGKGSSDWSYAWVPVLGPLVGGVLAGLLSQATI